MKEGTHYNLGVDIGSTTLKVALLDADGNLVYSDYQRHNAAIKQTANHVATRIFNKFGDCWLNVVLTGSVGMGYAERLNLGFIQEVVAAAETIKQRYPKVRTFIDMGGEDSKMIFFEDGKVPDIRMNGSCAGGTGAFIDQTATLLGVETNELNALAATIPLGFIGDVSAISGALEYILTADYVTGQIISPNGGFVLS